MREPPALDLHWLGECLGRSEPIERAALRYEPIGRFSTDVWRLCVGDGPDARRLVVKQPYRANRSAESAALEGALYARLGGSLPVRAPGFVGLSGDVLVLEEVLGLEAFDFRGGPDDAHAARAIDALADLHAAFWKRAADETWLPSLADRELRERWQHDFDLGWRERRSDLAAVCPAFAPIGDALVGRLATTLEPLGAPPTLLHGDAHAENLPHTETGEVVFLDWQSPRVGNAAFDVAVFTAMSFPIERRRAAERPLVAQHAARVRAHGIEWPDPWGDYQRALLRRAARIVEISADLPSLGWVFERCATAAADHDAGSRVV